MGALKRAREKRGWTCYEAAQRTGGVVSHQSIQNLEEDPDLVKKVRFVTIEALVAVYWPDLNVRDLLPKSPFCFAPADARAARSLLEGQATTR